MKLHPVVALAGAIVALLAPGSANATIRVANYIGTLGSSNTSFDVSGVFGAPQTGLGGLKYIISYTYDTDLGTRTTDPGVSDKILGGTIRGTALSPILEATLTIGSVTVRLGSNRNGYAETFDGFVAHGTEDFVTNGTITLVEDYAFSQTDLPSAPTSLDDLFPPIANGSHALAQQFQFQIYHRDPTSGLITAYAFGAGVLSEEVTYFVGEPLVSGDPGGSAVPEPASWALLLLGFGAIGGSLRHRRNVGPRIRFA